MRAVKATVAIPVAVKLSPFYSALAHFAAELEAADAANARAYADAATAYEAQLAARTVDCVGAGNGQAGPRVNGGQPR